jgi:hypothetical protein
MNFYVFFFAFLLVASASVAEGKRGGSGKSSSGKSSFGSTAKKAAIIGGTAYVGYKAGKLASKFSNIRSGESS